MCVVHRHHFERLGIFFLTRIFYSIYAILPSTHNRKLHFQFFIFSQIASIYEELCYPLCIPYFFGLEYYNLETCNSNKDPKIIFQLIICQTI